MFRQALGAAAFVLLFGCSPEQQPAMEPYVFVPPSSCEQKRISLTLHGASLRSVIDVLREVSGCNIVVDQDLDPLVTADLKDTPWHTVLTAAAAQNGLTLSSNQNVIRVSRRAGAAHPGFSGRLISVNADGADFRSIVSVLSALSARNIKVPAGDLPPVTLKLDKVPWDQALYLLAESHNLRVEIQDRAYNLVR